MNGTRSLKLGFRRIYDLHELRAVRGAWRPPTGALRVHASIVRRVRVGRARDVRKYPDIGLLDACQLLRSHLFHDQLSRRRDPIMKSETIPAASREESLRHSVEQVKDAAESLLRTTADETSEGWHRVRATLGGRARALRSDMAERARDFAGDARELGDKGQRLLRQYPWTAIGIGAGLGLLAGLLIRRR